MEEEEEEEETRMRRLPGQREAGETRGGRGGTHRGRNALVSLFRCSYSRPYSDRRDPPGYCFRRVDIMVWIYVSLYSHYIVI